MAFSIVADPIPTMQASAVSVSELTPLALFWWFPSSVSEQPDIALWVVQGTTRPGTLRATRRSCNPRLDSRQGARLYPYIIFLGSALETDAHSSVNTTSLYGQGRRRVRYSSQLEDNSITTAKDIDRAGLGRRVHMLQRGHIASGPLARQTPQ